MYNCTAQVVQRFKAEFDYLTIVQALNAKQSIVQSLFRKMEIVWYNYTPTKLTHCAQRALCTEQAKVCKAQLGEFVDRTSTSTLLNKFGLFEQVSIKAMICSLSSFPQLAWGTQ